MDTYHKINALFKRHKDGPKKGRLIVGEWATPELEYLANNQWEFTEKVDGTNIRIGYDPFVHPDDQVQFGGRTDNADLPKPLLSCLKATFEKYPYDIFTDVVPPRVVLYGEGYGPKIQKGGGNYGTDQKFVLFDVKVGDFWLDRDNVNDVAHKLGIDSVPVLGYGTLQDAIDIVSTGFVFNSQGAIVRYGAGGLNSRWGNFEAEGIVARPVVPMFTRKDERIITKIKAVDFK